MRDWDDAFANMKHVPGSERLPALWAEQAAAYRAAAPGIELAVPYGDGPRNVLDLVWPDGPARGLVVFVHGGYWLRLDRSSWTHLAAGARAHGWAVALPSYTLAPEQRIAGITREIGAAIGAAAARVEGPIRLAGHSAGGHLVTRMACATGPLAPDVRARVASTLSISGIHDLRPLLRTEMNASLRLDEAEACAESPALQRPLAGSRVVAWVGGAERPELIRQTRLLGLIWDGLDADIEVVVEDGHDHFSVIEGLADPSSPMTAALVGRDGADAG